MKGQKTAEEQKKTEALRLQKLEELRAKKRKGDEMLQKLEETRKNVKKAGLQAGFRQDWRNYMKIKNEGAPPLLLRQNLERILQHYRGKDVDLSAADRELLELLKQ